MIEKRLVQWYAADAGVDLDIAEREIVLTYVLRILADRGLLAQLAFKGGTAIRKLILGGQGRFSLDLDFTAITAVEPDAFVLDLAGCLHGQTYYGITFTIADPDYYATADSCGAEVTYRHDWVAAGRFGLQVSFRATPLLPVQPATLRPERYFEWLGIPPPEPPALDVHEIIGEKVRAAAQRSRVRDLYDLYQFTRLRFDRGLVRRIAVLKCWENALRLRSGRLPGRTARGALRMARSAAADPAGSRGEPGRDHPGRPAGLRLSWATDRRGGSVG